MHYTNIGLCNETIKLNLLGSKSY